MAKHFVAVSALFLAVAGLAPAQDADQPLKRAKVGDYVVFKSGVEQIKDSTVLMRQEVIAVTEKEVTIKFTMYFKGVEPKVTEQKVDITKKYDPAGVPRNKDLKIVETGTGQETLKINGKEYKCDWRSNRVTVKMGDMDIVSESKVWLSKDAPVYGLVRTESKTFGQVNVMVLTEESGNKKK